MVVVGDGGDVDDALSHTKGCTHSRGMFLIAGFW